MTEAGECPCAKELCARPEMQILFLKEKKEKENMAAGGHLVALAQEASIRDKRKTTEGTF